MAFKQFSPIPILEGGTNTQSFVHVFGVAYYDGASLNNIDVGTSGYVLTSNGISGPASFQAIPSPFFTWVDQTTTPVALTNNDGYVMDAGATLITATLPAVSPFGTVIVVEGKGSGLWTIAQNAGQTIHFGAKSTTTGATGSLSSTGQYDSVELLCITANTDFKVRSSVGVLYYV
jgi:hypothetical protein